MLVFVHELGHFLAAKWAGIKVSEFGLGFPPRIFSRTYGETTYSLNAIPFGGFVRIFGETPDQASISGPESERSFVNKPRWIQAAVLAAGIAFNVIFAWLVISGGFVVGLPTAVDAAPANATVQDAHVVVTSVIKGSPAEKAGLAAGDQILGIRAGADSLRASLDPAAVQDFIAGHPAAPITLELQRGSAKKEAVVVPAQGIVTGKPAIGISMDMIGVLRLSVPRALWEGGKLTISLIQEVAVGLGTFLGKALTFHADFSQVTGPVGIVSVVGSVSQLGFVYLMSFMAYISINLAVINLIPFPALDGGRLLLVIVEGIKGSPIRPKVANAINGIGFALLILVMAVVTVHDVLKLL